METDLKECTALVKVLNGACLSHKILTSCKSFSKALLKNPNLLYQFTSQMQSQAQV